MRYRRLAHGYRSQCRTTCACVALVSVALACESRDAELVRLRRQADVACQIAQATKERLDSTLGHWLVNYPDTMLHVTAAYGDTIGEQQSRCDAATAEYERFRRTKNDER